VNHAKKREKTLRSQFALLNFSRGPRKSSTQSFSFGSGSSIEVRPPQLPLHLKAKESKKPRHLFVICLSCLLRYGSEEAMMSSATIRADAAIRLQWRRSSKHWVRFGWPCTRARRATHFS